MFNKNSIFIDFSLNDGLMFIISDKKIFSKKIKGLKKTENLPLFFFEFIKKKKLKINKSSSVYVNIGPGHIISIRNSIILSKTISLIYKCKLFGYTNFNLLDVKKYTKSKAQLSFKSQNILLDLKKRNLKKIMLQDLTKYKKFNINLKCGVKDIKFLLLNNKFTNKIVPISY